jgi:hypothetical protein
LFSTASETMNKRKENSIVLEFHISLVAALEAIMSVKKMCFVIFSRTNGNEERKPENTHQSSTITGSNNPQSTLPIDVSNMKEIQFRKAFLS